MVKTDVQVGYSGQGDYKKTVLLSAAQNIYKFFYFSSFSISVFVAVYFLCGMYYISSLRHKYTYQVDKC